MSDPNRFLNAPSIELNQDQLAVLRAIADTFIARLTPEEEEELVQKLSATHTREQVAELARLSCSDLDGQLAIILAFLERALAPAKRHEVAMILTVLSKCAGSFALTGHLTRFQDLSRQEREKALLKWKNSYLQPLRLLYKLFSAATCNPIYSVKDSVLHRAMGYPSRDPLRTAPDYEPASTKERFPMLTLEQIPQEVDVIVVGSGAGGGT